MPSLLFLVHTLLCHLGPSFPQQPFHLVLDFRYLDPYLICPAGLSNLGAVASVSLVSTSVSTTEQCAEVLVE